MTQMWKCAVLTMIVLVAILGILIAFGNLPVLTGCGYYARCGDAAVMD
ncbi:hypothetical protein [Sphingomonas sp. IW22]